MRINPRVVSSAAAIALTCAVTAAAYFYKSRNTELNEVMVFCKLQFNAYSCFDKLISYVEAAKKSVCVCMPGIQNPAIQGRLVKLVKERNVELRIIIDRSGYNDSTDFLLKELSDVGAQIKFNNDPQYRMQHKFCLVDDKVLMTGTLNWGNDRSSDHWNYVYITSKGQLVEPVKKEFYAMWNEFSNDIGQEANTEELNESDATEYLNPDIAESENNQEQTTAVSENYQEEPTAASDSIQEQPTFRITVTTPEVYIT